MHITKTAAYNQANAEIARISEQEDKQIVMLFDYTGKKWVEVGTMETKAARKFETLYILNRMIELIKAS